MNNWIQKDTKETKLVLRHRKGFIKLAMKYGASLVPVYTFNEKKAYRVQIMWPNFKEVSTFNL